MVWAKQWSALLFALLTFPAAHCGEVVVQQSKACAPGCTERGNCNAETGRCECRWGYTGEACEVDHMAPCRQTPDDPGSCGNTWPKHCDCYRTCHRLYCRNPDDPRECAHELGTDMNGYRCWRHLDPTTPPSSQLPDTGVNDTVWYHHFVEEGQQYSSYLELPRDQWGRSGENFMQPLSACPDRCSNGRGVCFRWSWKEQPECLCRKGFNGTNCGTEDAEEACWFSPDCGGRGRCRSGFCHCRDGHWGMGCHRTTAFQPAPALPPGRLPDARIPSRLKIYMYDLPWDVAFPYEYNDGAFGRDPMYSAYEYFLRYFLTDTAVRTENPYEANMFYVPMLLYFYIGNVRDPVPHASRVLTYIRETWPFFNRLDGRDHFFFLTGDRGTCHLPRWMQDTGIKVVHFGLQRSGVEWNGVHNKEYGCMQVKRDLVVPPLNMFNEILPKDTEAYYQWLVSNGGHDGNRTLLFFFAGGVGDGTEYSGGTRQAIKKLLDRLMPKPPDVEFLEGRTGEYSTLLRTSKFCIAPYGYGWGLRLVQAIEFGCIPLVIQDHVYQPFEDFLPYEEFSVRMPLRDVPHMVEILRGYSEEQLAALRLGMAKYYRAFIWNREFGGRAYDWTLAGLQRRLVQLQGEYYEARPLDQLQHRGRK